MGSVVTERNSLRRGLQSACSKCGGEDIHLAYHKPGCSDSKCSCATCTYGSHAKQHEEHLHYHCRTCHFDWVGPTLDSTPLEQPVSSMEAE